MSSYAEIRDVVRAMRKGPIEIRTLSTAREEEPVNEAGDVVSERRVEHRREERARRARRRHLCQGGAVSRPDKKDAGPLQIKTLDEFVEHFVALGRKGVAVNRYKGLGEMNPDTLWATTMNPDTRTLLAVRAEDHTEADQMFTTLMGDQVEPRRKFIEEHAFDVRNLDI